MFTKFSIPIIENDKITLFRHKQPDPDAVCSQLALKAWIEKNFPNKTVKVLGDDTLDLYPYHDTCDDDFVKDSLAIVLDTASAHMIDDERYKMAKKVMKIDHHIPVDDFGDIAIVNQKAAAVCELLAYLFLDGDQIGYRITTECAEYLYAGIIADTNCFTNSSVTKWTINAAGDLANTDIDIDAINQKILSVDLNRFNYQTKIRNMLQYEDGMGYVILSQKELQELGINSRQAKRSITEFKHIKELKVWFIAAEKADGHYELSMRSKKAYSIHELAMSFNGGGHNNAVGIKDIPYGDLEALKQKTLLLIKRIDIEK